MSAARQYIPCSQRPIIINHPREYEQKLREARVIADFNERRATIIVGIDREARKIGGKLEDGWIGKGPIVEMIEEYLEDWYLEGADGPTDKEKIKLVKMMLDHINGRRKT